jgi:hypothetical protein
MTKYLSIAILLTSFLVGNAYGDDLIADVHFDDGSVLHNVKIPPHEVRVKHEGEYYDLDYGDLKSINFDVQPGTSDITRCAYSTPGENAIGMDSESCGTVGKEAIVTLKIKTKIGVETIDRFSTGDRGCSLLAHKYVFKIISKLTGKKISRAYRVTNLKTSTFEGTFYNILNQLYTNHSSPGCIFHKGKRKAIKSIVFKE